MRLRLSHNDRIEFDGQQYVVQRRTASGQIFLEQIDNREPLIASDEEIVKWWNQNRVHMKVGVSSDSMGRFVEKRMDGMKRDFQLLDEKLQIEARRRQAYVTEILKRAPTSITKTAIEPLILEVAAMRGEYASSSDDEIARNGSVSKRSAPSPSTVCRWISCWLRSGRDIRVLVSATHRRGNVTPRLRPEVAEAIERHVMDAYMTPERFRAKDILALVVNELAAINSRRETKNRLPIPSIKAIYGAINRLDKRDVVATRYGLKRARQEFNPVYAGTRVTYPLERVEVDHTILDLLVVDDQTGETISRPTITVLIDAFSRMVVGWHIGYDKPGCIPVAYALRHAILPKDYIPEKYQNLSAYPVWGVPTCIVTDIGAEFVSEWFNDSCALLGIDVQHCPPGKPNLKGKVERFFRTVGQDLIHKIPGTTFSNIADRGNTKSAERAVLTLSEINEIVHHWIVEIYSKSLHRGLRDVPQRCWEEGVKMHPAMLPPRASDLTALLAKPEQRTLQRTGIEFMGLRYNNEFVAKLVRRHGNGKTVFIRIDPDDLDMIYLHDDDKDEFVKIPSVDSIYTAGLTLRQHVLIKEYCAVRTEEYIRVSELASARAKLLNWTREVFHSRKGRRSARAASFLNYQDKNESPSYPVADAGTIAVPEKRHFEKTYQVPRSGEAPKKVISKQRRRKIKTEDVRFNPPADDLDLDRELEDMGW
jgi:putative transposase